MAHAQCQSYSRLGKRTPAATAASSHASRSSASDSRSPPLQTLSTPTWMFETGSARRAAGCCWLADVGIVEVIMNQLRPTRGNVVWGCRRWKTLVKGAFSRHLAPVGRRGESRDCTDAIWAPLVETS